MTANLPDEVIEELDDPENGTSEGGVNFTPSGESTDEEEEVLSRYEEYARMGVNGLIEQGAKFADLYNRSLATLEALADVCVALMTKYPAPIWTKGGDPRSDANKTAAKGYVAPKDKDKKIRDWGGQSEQYKKAIQKIYDKAEVGNNESQIRNNLKYWRQNLVKKVAPAEQLIALGMKTAKRGAGGAAKATGATKKATTATTITNEPIKVMEQIGPRIIDLRENVIKKGVVKTETDKKKLLAQMRDAMNNMMKIIQFLAPELQTEAAKVASAIEKEAKAVKDGQNV